MDRSDVLNVIINVNEGSPAAGGITPPPTSEVIAPSATTETIPGVPNTGFLADISQVVSQNPAIATIVILALVGIVLLVANYVRRRPSMSLTKQRIIDRLKPSHLKQLKSASLGIIPVLAIVLVTTLSFSTQAINTGLSIAAERAEITVTSGQTASTTTEVIATVNNDTDVDYQVTAQLNQSLPENLKLELANKNLTTSSTIVYSGNGATDGLEQIPLNLTTSVTGDVEAGEHSIGLTLSVEVLGEDPIITSISPSTGDRAGGETLLITGSNFYDSDEVKQVFVGANQCQVTASTATTVTCTAPASIVDGEQNIRIVTSFGEATLAGGYLYTSEAQNALTSLPRVAWEGGPSYWTAANGAQFTKAEAAGWSNPSFFPISVFFGKADPGHITPLKDAGINIFAPPEYSPTMFPLTNITNEGLFVLAGGEYTPADIGNNPGVVGRHISDECEMGYNGCENGTTGLEAENFRLSLNTQWVNEARALNDGRFTHANFGNGILRTFWAPNTMNQHVQLMDASSADKYTYTSPHVRDIIDGMHDAPDWPNGVPVDRAYSYGWQADQMRRFQNPSKATPVWTFIETAQPYLNEGGARAITPQEIEGAVWSALIHEARGISYFQHNNASTGCTSTYSIVNCPELQTEIKRINAKVHSLASVINTQSYYNATRTVNGFDYNYYTFNNGTDTMLKVHNGSAYVFAGLGMRCNNQACTSGTTDATGSKTFVIPEGVTGTQVEVVGEGRTIPIIDGQFSDNFANEYTHHVYRISL